MGRVKDGQFWESARYNNYSFMQYYNRLVELSVSMFEWVNVPDTIDTRFLELVLFADGQAVFFKDEDMGKEGDYLALRCAMGGQFNVYHIPTKRRAFASNGYNKELTIDNSVIIYNNYLRTNSALDVELFSKRLYNLDRTIDVNCNAQKTPILLSCEENQKLTLKNAYMKYEGNEPVIFGDKKLSPDSIRVFNTGAPYVADRLYMLKTNIWNEALTYLGIQNTNINKKERLITDEVTRSDGGTLANRFSRLEMRKKACREINKMFGLNMDCRYRDEQIGELVKEFSPKDEVIKQDE